MGDERWARVSRFTMRCIAEVQRDSFGERHPHGFVYFPSSLLDGPNDRAPRKLGVARLVLRNLGESAAHVGIGGAVQPLAGEDRRHRFSDASFVDCGHGQLQQRDVAHGRAQGKPSRPARATGVTARQSEAQSRMLNLVECGSLSIHEKLGRSAKREQLE